MKVNSEDVVSKREPSKRQERKKAKADRVQKAFSEPSKVEVIPADSELEPKEIKKQRVAAYCRVSTDQEAQTMSYTLQVEHYTKYITNNDEWIFAGVYADEGITGTSTLKRKEFQRMIEDCEAGKIDLILTKDIRRFARNTLDCISYVRLLKHIDPPVAIYFEDEGLNTLDRRNEATLAILSSVAQGESENKSEAMHWSITRRFANGLPLCPTWALLGYTTDDFGRMVIVEDEAEIVRFIYQSYLAGTPSSAIAQSLTDKGFLTVKGNTIWSSTSVLSILHNEKYCGDVVMQKTYTPDCLTHKTVKNHGQMRQYRMQDHHTGIVTRDDWLTVQSIIEAGGHRKKKTLVETTTLHVHVRLVKKGCFKGFYLFDPSWSCKDVSVAINKMHKK